MNLKQAAARLGVHYQTAYKWVRSGELSALRIGGRYEVSDAAITRFLANHRAELDQPSPRVEERRSSATSASSPTAITDPRSISAPWITPIPTSRHS